MLRLPKKKNPLKSQWLSATKGLVFLFLLSSLFLQHIHLRSVVSSVPLCLYGVGRTSQYDFMSMANNCVSQRLPAGSGPLNLPSQCFDQSMSHIYAQPQGDGECCPIRCLEGGKLQITSALKTSSP